jgi:DNA-3-methyladenine glycosylase
MENSLIKWSEIASEPAKLAGLSVQQKPTRLGEHFFGRDTLTVARELLGKILVVRPKGRDSGMTVARIVETEAYLQDDPASHSCRGKTPRSEIMFGPPGRVYVYFIYGMYQMLNFVTESDGIAGAVLIRAVEPIFGEELMRKRRRGAKELTSGPGKLCQAMGIKGSHNGEDLAGGIFSVWDDIHAPNPLVRVSPRVGISKAETKLWRYYIADNRFVSKTPLNAGSKAFRLPLKPSRAK